MTAHPLDELIALARAQKDRPKSKKIAKKFGEEAVEVVIEAIRKDEEKFIEESVDLFYYYALLLADLRIDEQEIWARVVGRLKKEIKEIKT